MDFVQKGIGVSIPKTEIRPEEGQMAPHGVHFRPRSPLFMTPLSLLDSILKYFSAEVNLVKSTVLVCVVHARSD